MNNIFETDKTFVAATYKRFDIALKSGEGATLTDFDGKSYIDFGSGIGVNIFGANDKAWKEAVIAQLNLLQHTSNLYYNEPCAQLAKLLCEKTGLKKVFFANSGCEANECAIKVARKWASQKKGSEFYHVITLTNSFHGRTLTTLAATGQESFHKLFLPLTEGFLHADVGDLAQIREFAKTQKVAAVLLECVQGEGGVLPLGGEFLRGVEDLCREFDLLFMIDEVQTGNGRTGKLYAYEHFGLSPDVVTTAKGLGGGLPVAACIMGERVADVFGRGDHGSTFGGNPVACAGALNVLLRLDEAFLKSVAEKSVFVFESLSGAEGVESVSGLGLMVGVKPSLKSAQDVVEACMQNGVLPLMAKDKIRLLPPLNISQEELKKGVEVLKMCLR